MSNRMLDFQSSTVEKIVKEGNDVRVRLLEPMEKQVIELSFKNAELVGDLLEFPQEVDDAYLIVDQQPTTLSIPCEHKGEVELQFVFHSGRSIVIKAQSIQLTSIGEPIVEVTKKDDG